MKNRKNNFNKSTICHVNTTFIHKAGSARRTFSIIKALSKNNYRVIQVTGRDFEPHRDWDLSDIKFVSIPYLVKYINPINDIIAFFKLWKFFRNLKPQLVHTHLAKAGILGRLAARWAHIPYIVHTVHGPTFSKNIHPIKRHLYLFLERICGRFTSYFIFIGEELRDKYIKNRVCSIEKTRVIQKGHPKSDFDFADRITQEEIKMIRKKFLKNRKSFLIGYIGRLVPSKAQHMAIRVVKMVRDRGIDGHLALIGEGYVAEEKKYEAKLRRLAEDLKVEEYVYFMGYQSNVLTYMKAMDVLILTSKYEGLPNIAIEAGMVSMPLVSFKVCGISEVIQNGVNGYIVDQEDVNAMAEKLIFLARNPGVSKKIGHNARHNVRNPYTIEKMIKEQLEFYESILKNGK